MIHGDRDVVADFEEGNDAGALAVRAVNVRARAADRRPRAAEATRPFREMREAPPRLGDFLDAVAAVEQVAGGELRVERELVSELKSKLRPCECFRTKVHEYSSRAVSLKVSIKDTTQKVEVHRDKSESFVVAGIRYELAYPSVSVSSADKPTTN